MKAGSATKMALNTISTTLFAKTGKVYENLMVDVRATNHKLIDRACRIISAIAKIDRERAFDFLQQAGGDTKVAVAMAMGVSQAASKLEAARGHLSECLL